MRARLLLQLAVLGSMFVLAAAEESDGRNPHHGHKHGCKRGQHKAVVRELREIVGADHYFYSLDLRAAARMLKRALREEDSDGERRSAAEEEGWVALARSQACTQVHTQLFRRALNSAPSLVLTHAPLALRQASMADTIAKEKSARMTPQTRSYTTFSLRPPRSLRW